MAERDYYEILGVARNASPEEIQRAYRKRAFELHPDRNPDDSKATEKFKELAAAYDVLSDPAKRSRYDRYGHEGIRTGGFAPRDFASIDEIFRTFADIFGGGSIFETFFGGGRRGDRGAPRGASLRAEIPLTLEEVASGVSKTIALSRHEPCDTCSGSGAKPGTGRRTCSTCGGSGVVQQVRGFFALQAPCGSCEGAGSVLETPCASCRGSGRVRRKREVTVRVPKGIEDGMQIRLEGEGDAGASGGPPGDLYCVVLVAPHPVFERRGDDLYCELRLPFPILVLGGNAEAPTLDGSAPLTVPRGTPDGEVVRLRGKGLPRFGGSGRGDLYARLLVEVPKKPTAREEELLREIEEIQRKREPTRGGRKFFERVRDFFE
jgi:molecular chaperone DnaJ